MSDKPMLSGSDNEIRLISQADVLIRQLAEVGCPKELLDRLRFWNMERKLDYAKYRQWVKNINDRKEEPK